MSRTQRKHGKGPRSKSRIGRAHKNKLWSRKKASLNVVSARLDDVREPPEHCSDNHQPLEADNTEPAGDINQSLEDSNKPLEDNSQQSAGVGVSFDGIELEPRLTSELSQQSSTETPSVPVRKDRIV